MQKNSTPDAHHGAHKKHGMGPSSYWMHDPEEVFKHLALDSGDWVLDLGCGPGDYSLRLAQLVGPEGKVFALDKWQTAIERLAESAAELGRHNLEPVLADITRELPLQSNCIDLCLISTVLHIFPPPKFEQSMFTELRRVLKPSGRLAVIECKKEDQPWGPPKHMRIAPEELRKGLEPYGFAKSHYADLGKTYMMIFASA
jgi:ubiquinone/menaquinone biosynthesis C-methylase UbiE